MPLTLPPQTSELWKNVPDLSAEQEQKAAEETIAFLKEVRFALSDLVNATKQGASKTEPKPEKRWSLGDFSPFTVDFVIATLGLGEVRITMNDGEVKAADTSIQGLWRVQDKRGSGAAYFTVGRLPQTILAAADEGADTIGELKHDPEGKQEFAAPAIITELSHALADADLTSIPEDPPFAVEITRQPLAPGDRGALSATVGTGALTAELMGFARSKIYQTAVRGLWYSRIINNAGVHLLASYVVARIPAAVPASVDAFPDGVTKCEDYAEWLEHDLERGAIGLKRTEKAKNE